MKINATSKFLYLLSIVFVIYLQEVLEGLFWPPGKFFTAEK